MARRLTFVLLAFTLVVALAAASPRRASAQVPAGGGAAPAAGAAGGATNAANTIVAPMTTGTAAISGVVIDEVTRLPVAGAVVYLGPPNRGPQGEPVRHITDAKGRFLFTQLPAWDNYFLQASKFGYLQGNYGRASSGALGGRVRVADGQWVRDLEIPMRRYGSISGLVLDEHGDPIVNAYVRVLLQVPVTGATQLASGHVATTDDRGHYRISGLLPGTYVVQMPTVQSSVPASVSTRTLAGLGAPAPGAPEPATALLPRDPIVDVDDQVQLVAGRYPNPPRSADGRPTTYPITFYPSALTIASAVPIQLGAGEDRLGVDVRVTVAAAAKVSGVIDGPPESFGGLTVRLLAPGLESLGEGSEAATALVGEHGEFTFVNVPAGAYTIDARRVFGGYQNSRVIGAVRSLPAIPAQINVGMGIYGVFSGIEGTSYSYKSPSGDTAHFGRQPIVVEGRDLTGVRVVMRRGVSMSGRIVWEGERSASSPTSLMGLQPARGDASLGISRAVIDRATPDVFAFTGLAPGEYVIAVLSSRLKSFVCKDKDFTYAPIDTSAGVDITDCVLTFTDKSITVTGTVRDERAASSAAIDAAVLVFPVEREQWTAYAFSPARLKSLNTTPAGTFRFTSLPEGDYYFLALPGDQVSAWQDPAFLERAAAQATRVSLKWGETATQNLTMKVVK